ncbi:hypothetical protein EJ110_NYTH17975 [Nymphaea thermarum]|nr:hypothetical protein EJ110_NYTH17975 [Nymphaea thermarum]
MDQRVLPTTESWPYFLGKTMEEMRQSLLYATFELECTRIAAKEEIERQEQHTKDLLQLLQQAYRERDEANEKCKKLLFLQTNTTTTASPPEETATVLKRVDSTTSECDSISRASSSPVDSFLDFEHSDDHNRISPPPQPVPATTVATTTVHCDVWQETDMKLPEKGKLLQAVMNAGPLLQTLLLAGPLPQWRHPPPPLESFQIPPVAVAISGGSAVTEGSPAISRKRSPESYDSGDRSVKLQRLH